MTLTQGNKSTQSLPAGHILTITAGVASSAVAFRQDIGGTSIGAGETVNLGPYPDATWWEIVCLGGSVSFSIAPADMTALQLGADATIEISQTREGDGSFQPIAADLELDAAAGTSEAGDTAFLAPIMGNLLGDDLTKENNYLAGVIGALSVTGERASVLPVGGVLGVLMDGVKEADGIIVAHVDGGDPSTPTNARAAFAVSQFNNHADTSVEYGLDLHYTPGAEVDALLSGTAEPFKTTKAAIRFPNGLWFATLSTAITANTTTTDAPAGSIGITSHATGAGKLFVSDGSKWQFAGVS